MNPETPVSQIMTTKLVTVESDSRLQKVRQIFEQHGFHHIPVMEFGKLVGIISKSDFFHMHYHGSQKPALNGNAGDDVNYIARDIMTEYPMHLDSDDTVGLAADIRIEQVPQPGDGGGAEQRHAEVGDEDKNSHR